MKSTVRHGLRYLPVMLAGLSALNACGVGQSSAATAQRQQVQQRTSAVYTLTPGQTIALTPSANIKLERVNDSRCRTGAVCVWKGYISYSFTLTSNGASSSFVLAEDMPGGTNSVMQQGLRFTLAGVEPAEPPPLDALAPTYRVSLRVEIS